jgi:fucose permease
LEVEILTVFLLFVIYIAFISLGLPDSLLGAAWPAMSRDLGVSLSMAGVVSMIIAGGTILSSLMSNRLIHRFGTGKVMLISVAATALALMGFSFASSLWVICLLAIPLGLGAGAVDAALNNYVALHYKARHMNWLHCMWGVGATAGPIILASFLSTQSGWAGGYKAISFIQIILVAILACSIPVWRIVESKSPSGPADEKTYITAKQAIRTPGLKLALLTFFCFVGFESSAGLWASSYLVTQKGLDAATAALWASLYFGGTMIGRIISGFLSIRLSSKMMIRVGCSLALVAAIMLVLPLPSEFSLAGFVLLGLGNAPLYPSMIHETPRRFGKTVSQAAIGLQMAFAYIGTTFLPPLEGLLSRWFTLSLIPWAVLILVCGGLVFSEMLNRTTKRQKGVVCF